MVDLGLVLPELAGLEALTGAYPRLAAGARVTLGVIDAAKPVTAADRKSTRLNSSHT